MTAPADDVLRSLRAVRRRMLTQSFLTTLTRTALALGGMLVAAGVVRRWLLQAPPWDSRLAAAAGAVLLLWSAGATWRRRRTLAQTAGVIDRLGQTRDRFLTALVFSGEAQEPGLRSLAVRECRSFIAGRNFARLVRLRMPRELPYLIVPALALALLSWEARETLSARAAETASAQAGVEGTAKALEQMAREMERANEKTPAEDLKKIADELKRSAQQLRAEARTSEEAERAALRELSELEKLVQEMQKQLSAPTPAELRELAKALEQQEQTKQAAAAMAAGDPAKAAEALEKAMKDLAEAGDERTQEQIEQALKEAMERLAAQQRKLSEALEKLAKQAQQSGDSSQGAMQLSKELADLLKKLPRQAGQAPRDGKPLDAQSLKNLLAALQNLKFGEGEPSEGKPGEGPPQGIVMMEGANPKPGGGEGDPRLPSGQPGSERDTGTTASPFGKEAGPPAAEGQSQSITGRLGKGETLQQFLPGIADASKSKRRYKELYEAMAPAAEDAVVQENIPLGSRFFIKRYFESIRPKE